MTWILDNIMCSFSEYNIIFGYKVIITITIYGEGTVIHRGRLTCPKCFNKLLWVPIPCLTVQWVHGTSLIINVTTTLQRLADLTDFCGWQKNCSCLLGIWKIFFLSFCFLQISYNKFYFYNSNITMIFILLIVN